MGTFLKACEIITDIFCFICLFPCRILTDWLEVKLGGGNQSEDSEKELKGKLKTLCISHSLTNIKGQTHEVHISIKVSLRRN